MLTVVMLIALVNCSSKCFCSKVCITLAPGTRTRIELVSGAYDVQLFMGVINPVPNYVSVGYA